MIPRLLLCMFVGTWRNCHTTENLNNCSLLAASRGRARLRLVIANYAHDHLPVCLTVHNGAKYCLKKSQPFHLNWLYINNITTFKASNFQKISCEIVVVYSKIRCDFKIASTPLWRYISCKHTHAYLTPHQSFTSNEIQPQKCGIWRD